MKITGRITANATVNTTTNEKQVVNFSIAINNGGYRKDGEYKELTTFVNCSYWLDMAAAGKLQKGVEVQLKGHMGLHVYQNRQEQYTAG
ncbi:single-stranded DNA-binding protein [Taibaiella chishuiensis]|uniref:Single-stranded DNA-binding protein n=1 Tax=Taibaiella chishuiensis TaxID=1434707 RepID=A0A2P8D0U2_9BACT|nr:single-stranded DNA-binding protein [Taibaiella chishuiensis]PSK90842.1 single-stranded DNA-binding protein [Taibaiella chishuiensis]